MEGVVVLCHYRLFTFFIRKCTLRAIPLLRNWTYNLYLESFLKKYIYFESCVIYLYTIYYGDEESNYHYIYSFFYFFFHWNIKKQFFQHKIHQSSFLEKCLTLFSSTLKHDPFLFDWILKFHVIGCLFFSRFVMKGSNTSWAL